MRKAAAGLGVRGEVFGAPWDCFPRGKVYRLKITGWAVSPGKNGRISPGKNLQVRVNRLRCFLGIRKCILCKKEKSSQSME